MKFMKKINKYMACIVEWNKSQVTDNDDDDEMPVSQVTMFQKFTKKNKYQICVSCSPTKMGDGL